MIYLFLSEGFEEIEAVTTIDVLRRAEIDICIVSISLNLFVVGAHGITLRADKLYSDVDFANAEMLVLPGGMPGTNNLANYKPLMIELEKQNIKGKWIAAICAAPLVLGRLGILNNHKAVCYPGFELELQGATIENDKQCIISDNIITARGPGCVYEFAFNIIKVINPQFDIDILKRAMIIL